MPGRIFIRPPEPPYRKMPRNVSMTTIEPSPWLHNDCKQPAILYADGTIWCNPCKRKVREDECTNIFRARVGRQIPSPVTWKRIDV